MTERKSQILDAAASLFRHYGYSKTTMADIARNAGVGVGTLYLEFPSKEAIGAALSERCHAQVLSDMQRAADGQRDFAGRFRSMMSARCRGLQGAANEGAHSLDLVDCGCRAADMVRKDFRAEEERLLTGLIFSATYEQVFDCTDPNAAARTVLTILDAVVARAGEPGGCADDLARQVTDVIDLLLNGLVRR